MIKIRADINEFETRSTVEKINRTRSWFFERINRIDKALARLIQKNRERTQINKIMNEKGEVTTNPLNLPAPGRRHPLYIILRFSRELCF